MYLLRRAFAFFFPQKSAAQPTPEKQMLHAFILEPILTPSGLVDDSLHTVIVDLNPHAIADISVDYLPDSHLSPAVNPPQTIFDSGVFAVGNEGKVSIDFLADSGGYQGQIAIFSLDGMEKFEPGSQAFIQEAAHRALSDSILGHIVITDQTEGAKFSGELGEANTNYGDYLGVKTFTMNAGDKFGIMLVPNGTVQQVFDHPGIEGDLHPLFSMATANPNDAFHLGQIADVTGNGHTFVMEDMRVDTGSDRDYNDVIFQVRGATGTAVHLDDVIDHNHDWRSTDSGKELIADATQTEPTHPNPIDPKPTNLAPHSLQFDTETFYTADETIKLNSAKIFDPDGVSDIAKVDFWIRHDGGNWQDINDAKQFTVDPDGYATFNYELHNLTTGHYELKGTAYDSAGASSNTFTEQFTILSLPKSDSLPETVRYDIERAMNLDNYTSQELANVHQWVVSVQSGQNPQALAASLGATNIGLTGHIPNTYIWSFATNSNAYQVFQQLNGIKGVEFAYPNVASEIEPLFTPSDPLFSQQWNWGSDNNSTDANITEAQSQWWGNGNGVVIGVVDTGVEYTHPDLKDNYRPDLSRDFVEFQSTATANTYDSNPMAVGTTAQSAHGTAIAGIIAASANNNIGISGVAPEADFAALRLIDTTTTIALVTDQQIADAVSYVNDDIDIYNNSWGLVNNFSPKPMGTFELHAGATEGRDGLGNIYVFAAGNNAQNGDNVNYDSFANSRYAIAVGAVDYNGQETTYSNPGASLLISAFSSGAGKGITTTDLTGAGGENPGDYTDNFGGTSAAAATISGVVALMLQANSTLTWRDIKEILVETAQKTDPTDADWVQNGAGYWVNDKFGFGLVNAQAAVQTARNWQKLTSEVKVSASEIINGSAGIQIKDNQTVERKFTISDDITVESVEVMFDAKHQNRGDLEVKLISPDGTESILAAPRNDSGDNYQKWVFTSNRNWGESSQGDWKLQVTDKNGNGIGGDWNAWKLNVYGTKTTVNLYTTDYNAHENGDTGQITVSRTGNTENPLTVNFNIEHGRPSTPGIDYIVPNTDYNSLTGSITIPAGATTATIPITPIDDAIAESNEEMALILRENNTYEIGRQTRSPVMIADNELPEVHVGTRMYEDYSSESGNITYFYFDRNIGSLDEEIVVNYALSGSAINGKDYELLSQSIVIKAGNTQSESIAIIPINDNLIEGKEDVIVSVMPGTGYKVRPAGPWVNNSVSMPIYDNDPNIPTVSLKTTKPEAVEGGDFAQFTINITDGAGNPLTLTSPLTVDHGMGGHRNLGSDLDFVATSAATITNKTITIPAGVSSVTVDIKAIDDKLVEGEEGFNFYLYPDLDSSSPSGYSSTPDYVLGPDETKEIRWKITEQPLKWVRQLGTSGYDYANAIALDNAGNTYITGRTSGSLAASNSNELYDAFVAKYDTSGTLIWKQQLGDLGYDTANGIAVDSSGNIYINGWTDGVGGRNCFLAKYDNNGNLVAKTSLGASNSNSAGYDISNGSISVASDGSVYLAGYTYGSLDNPNAGEADAFVVKYNSDLDIEWIRQLGTSGWDEAQALTLDNTGSVYVAGHTKGSLNGTNNGDSDIWFAKYNSSGVEQWVKQIGTSAEDQARSIAVDNAGNLYISGQTRGSLEAQGSLAGNTDAFVTQFDSSSGDSKWTRQYGSSNGYAISSGVAADSFGNVYITGRTNNGWWGGTSDAWVTKLNSNGDSLWGYQLGTTTDDGSNGIAVNSTGFYLTGYTGASLNGQQYFGNTDAWVAKFA